MSQEAYEVVCDSADREGWLAKRRSGIGSSDSPAILGLSPFQSAIGVYADKIGEAEIDGEETEAMRWGKILEPHILAEFARETGRDVDTAGLLLRSLDRPWTLATLDGEQSCDERGTHFGVVEAKATGWRAGDWSDGIPDHVMVQVQHQLAVTGRDWGSVVVLLFGCKLLWADVERDSRMIDDVLLPAEEDFWRRVQEREPVAPDGSQSAAAALKRLYPKPIPGRTVQLSGAFLELDQELVEINRQLSPLNARKKQIEQLLKAEIGDAELGYLNNGVAYTHREQSRRGYTVDPTTFRVLRRVASKGF